MFVAHLEFTAMDLFPEYEDETIDYRNNSVTITNASLYDFDSNQSYNDTVTINCGIYYIVGSDDFNSWNENSSLWEQSYWVNSDWYSTGWSVYESLGYDGYNITMRDLYHSIAWNNIVRDACDEDFSPSFDMPIIDVSSGYEYNFLSIDVPEGYAIEYIQLDASHQYYGCGYTYLSYYLCSSSDYYNHNNYSIDEFFTYSEGVNPYRSDTYYGGWENITIDFDLKFITYGEYQSNFGSEWDSEDYEGIGSFSIWPTSEYEFTLYYRFVSVVPVE
jgi:hypothetical protein